MKKETLVDQLGWAYFYLTVVFTLFMIYLKLAEGWPISWWWVFAPIWVSVAAALVLTIVCIIGAKMIIKNEKTTYKD